MRTSILLDQILEGAADNLRRTRRPLVTLTYAQSLDGSLTLRRGEPFAISGSEAQRFTHQLRDAHDAILVGIGTVLSDDPQLTVRKTPGSHPQPIILDSRLRFPLKARLLESPPFPWIATISPTNPVQKELLIGSGARIVDFQPDSMGYVSLNELLDYLGENNICCLMVEGGARVITNFLRSGLVDQVILTISPRYIGGLRAVETEVGAHTEFPTLNKVEVFHLGKDIVLWGKINTPSSETGLS